MTTFRTASDSELSVILDWAASEGWNPGLDDATAFYASDPNGFFVAIEDDRPVAAISVVNHTDHFAFLGLYIVLPSHRGRGVGYALWQHALQHAEGRTIGLDGVPAQQANYAASGFVAAGGTTRFSGHIAPNEHADVHMAQATDLEKLIEREAAASGVRKNHYLSAWFTSTSHRTTIVEKQGSCTVRQCRSGSKIGPLIASNTDAALRLMQHASAMMGPEVMIDVPAASVELSELCRDLGMVPGFETARMYRGTPPATSASIFAVTSLELG